MNDRTRSALVRSAPSIPFIRLHSPPACPRSWTCGCLFANSGPFCSNHNSKIAGERVALAGGETGPDRSADLGTPQARTARGVVQVGPYGPSVEHAGGDQAAERERG